jgi:hypothetical protein
MRYIKCNVVENVAANGVATIKFPLGVTYERVLLQLGGGSFTKSMITDIQFKINGKMFWRCTGSRVDLMNSFKALTAAATMLVIDFTEQDMKEIIGTLGGTIAATKEAGVQSFTAEITIAGATTPSLTVWAQVSEPSANPVVTKLVHINEVISGAQRKLISVPWGYAAGGLLKRIWVFHTGLVTSLEVRRNNVMLHEDLPNAVNNHIQTEKRRVTQTNLQVFDPIITNMGSDLVATKGAASGPEAVNSFDVFVTTSAADTLNIYVEYQDTNDRV